MAGTAWRRLCALPTASNLLIPIGRASVVVLVPVFKPRFARAKRKNYRFAVLLPLAMYDQLQFLTSTEEPPACFIYSPPPGTPWQRSIVCPWFSLRAVSRSLHQTDPPVQICRGT